MVIKKKTPKVKEELKDNVEEGNSANDILIKEDTEEMVLEQRNTVQDVIREISKTLFEKYTKKTSNLTDLNIEGMIQAESLNEYMEKNFGYRYTVLDVLCKSKRDLALSSGGFGIATFIESIKSVQATIEQHEIPEALRRLK